MADAAIQASVTGGAATGEASLATYALLSLAQVRGALETDLNDDLLSVYVDAAALEIERHAGPHGTRLTIQDSVQAASRSTYVQLPRPAVEVHSVTISGETLGADNYELQHGGLSLWVKYFRPSVWDVSTYNLYPWQLVVDYTAKDDRPLRRRALIQLVKIAFEEDGLASERSGDYSRSPADLGRARQRVFASLRYAHSRIA